MAVNLLLRQWERNTDIEQTKCLKWAIVIGQWPSSVVRRQQFALKAFSVYNPGSIYSKLGRKHWSDLQIKNSSKSFRSKIQDGRHCGGHLEFILFASSPERKGQLPWNLVGSIGLICRSKLAIIVLIWHPRWPPTCLFCFFFWTERRVDSKLGRKHQGDLQMKNSWNRSGQNSKMAAIAAILELYFGPYSLTQKANWLETW